MSGALYRLGQRMAARNNLTLFAWIAALVLPAGLQLIAGMQEEVREYLAGYFGPFTLYFFFVMTYGFAAIFVCFYQLSAYRRQGTLDMLRISRLTPWQVLRDVFVQLQQTLLPPIAGFGIIFTAYLMLSPERGMISGLGGGTLALGILNVVLSEMLLCAIICLGLLRGEAVLSAISAVLVLPLNIAPIALMFYANGLRENWEQMAPLARGADHLRDSEQMPGPKQMPLLADWFTSAPWLFYVIGVAIVIALLLWLAHVRLARLWPPQLNPGK